MLIAECLKFSNITPTFSFPTYLSAAMYSYFTSVQIIFFANSTIRQYSHSIRRGNIFFSSPVEVVI